jgi:hypothetical protein
MTSPEPATDPKPADADALIRAWQRDRSAELACFVCGGGPVTVTDASVRPHAEWYIIDCAACGHRSTVHRPLSFPSVSGEA